MGMADFASLADQHKDLSVEAQIKAGQATGSDMAQKHKEFLAMLIAMLDRKEMDPYVPSSMLNQADYDKLDELGRSAVDVAVLNLADQLRRIEGYFRSTQTPNASPQLQTMIEHFWDMKTRLEEKYGDVLKF
jgi:hypothetical protein